jgi:archaemetzincin
LAQAPDSPASLAEAVDVLAVGSVEPPTLAALAARLSLHVELPCHVGPPLEGDFARVKGREQLDAGALLAALEPRAGTRRRILVGVAAEDIAIPVFTFVFGLARQGGPACVVSLARADPAFYGLPADERLRDERVVAEIRHELGHLAALEHCADRSCLISFAGSIERADARGARFCEACRARLPAWLAYQPGAPVAS